MFCCAANGIISVCNPRYSQPSTWKPRDRVWFLEHLPKLSRVHALDMLLSHRGRCHTVFHTAQVWKVEQEQAEISGEQLRAPVAVEHFV